MKKAMLALIVFCFFHYFAIADTDVFSANCSTPTPDISGWEIVRALRVEFRLSDETVAYLGVDKTYRNPADPGEFVRVISRHMPGIFLVRKPTNERLFSQVVVDLYAKKDQDDFFSRMDKKTDPVLYTYWRVQKDPRTGRDMRDGNVNIWLLKSSGECLTAQNEKIGIQFLSEDVGNGKPRTIFVGVKYQVGDSYHILKVDRRDLIRPVEGGK